MIEVRELENCFEVEIKILGESNRFRYDKVIFTLPPERILRVLFNHLDQSLNSDD